MYDVIIKYNESEKSNEGFTILVRITHSEAACCQDARHHSTGLEANFQEFRAVDLKKLSLIIDVNKKVASNSLEGRSWL